MAEKSNVIGIGVLIALILIGALLIVILVPSSYDDLEYYEMGFVKHKTTGRVDTSKIYRGGRHWIGVLNIFAKFPADLQTILYSNVEIFNKEKLAVSMKCALHYRLQPENLDLLFKIYEQNYAVVVEGTALAALKSEAPSYTVDEYRLQRTNVTKGLSNAISLALSGKCCRKNCASTICKPGCIPFDKCKTEDKGMFVELVFFQLYDVKLTPEQEYRYLQRVLEQEKKDTEFFKQNETLIRKETEQERIKIENEAFELLQNATAEKNLILSKAGTKARALRENAQKSGLNIVHAALNITEQKHKNSLDYIRTLRYAMPNIYLGFQYMVAQP